MPSPPKRNEGQAAALEHVEQLFDRHFAQFGYPATLAHLVVDGLRVKMPSDRDVLAALAECEGWIDRLLPSTTPTNYRLYRNYKIVLHRGRFYAIPRSLGRFSIEGGIVIPLGNADAAGAILRFVLVARKYVRRLPVLRSVVRFGWHISQDFLRALDLRLRAVPVLSAADLRSLLQNIDNAEATSGAR